MNIAKLWKSTQWHNQWKGNHSNLCDEKKRNQLKAINLSICQLRQDQNNNNKGSKFLNGRFNKSCLFNLLIALNSSRRATAEEFT